MTLGARCRRFESCRPDHIPMESWIHGSIGIFFGKKSEVVCGILQLDILEFGGQWPLTMRYGLRRSNEIISRLVASSRSAHGIRQIPIYLTVKHRTPSSSKQKRPPADYSAGGYCARYYFTSAPPHSTAVKPVRCGAVNS